MDTITDTEGGSGLQPTPLTSDPAIAGNKQVLLSIENPVEVDLSWDKEQSVSESEDEISAAPIPTNGIARGGDRKGPLQVSQLKHKKLDFDRVMYRLWSRAKIFPVATMKKMKGGLVRCVRTSLKIIQLCFRMRKTTPFAGIRIN